SSSDSGGRTGPGGGSDGTCGRKRGEHRMPAPEPDKAGDRERSRAREHRDLTCREGSGIRPPAGGSLTRDQEGASETDRSRGRHRRFSARLDQGRAPSVRMVVLALLCALLPSAQDPAQVELAGFTPFTQTVRGRDGEDLAAVRRARAVWPVANGKVFAFAGYGEAANRLSMLTGPQYQTRDNHEPHGAFGSTWIEVLRDDAVAEPAE